MQVAPGTAIDRYTVEAPIGRGGMAVVYRVRHNQLGSVHALKVLTLPTDTIRARLMQEGRIQSQFNHPNLVNVTDVVEVEGSPGLVMEYVDGPTLAQFLDGRRLALAQVDHLARGILEGAAAAHEHGLIHRDLKPANILLLVTPTALVPKIADFGLAKLVRQPPGEGHTRSGAAMGTPSYMAPEQIRDSKTVDQRADVFALGAILYELVTGRRAFVGNDTMEVFDAVTTGRFEDPRQLVSDLPDRMERAILGALQVDPDARITTSAELYATWTGVEGEGVREASGDSNPWGSDILSAARTLGAVRPEPPEERTSESTFSLDEGVSEPAAPSADTLEPKSLERPTADSLEQPTPSSEDLPTQVRRGAIVLAVIVAVVTVLAVVGLIGALAGWFVSEKQAEAEVPVVTKDAQLQELFRLGWNQFLAGDLRAAETTLGRVAEQEPEAPLPRLLHAASLDLSGHLGLAYQALDEATADFADDDRPEATLIGLYGTSIYPRAPTHGWGAFLKREPDDFLARLLAARALWGAYEDRVPFYDEAVALRPTAIVARLAKVDDCHRLRMMDLALEELRAIEQEAPATPGVAWRLGRHYLFIGDHAKANEHLVEAVRNEPDSPDARFYLASTLGAMGDFDGRAEQLELVFGPTIPAADRIRLLHEDAWFEFGAGRNGRAGARLGECIVHSVDSAQYADAVLCAETQARMALILEDPQALEVALESLVRLTAQPEVPAALTARMQTEALYLESWAAGSRGETERARRQLTRLGDLEPEQTEWLLTDPVLSSRSEQVLGMIQIELEVTPQGPSVGTHRAPCEGLTMVARTSAELGGMEDALDLLTRVAPDQGPCSTVFGDAYSKAEARVMLAELALARGEAEVAAEYVTAFRTLWPDADPDHPLVLRAAQVASVSAGGPVDATPP
jgi:serine/threonine protein kinase/tetratricopeptide (TPR) repeat protein